MATSTITALVAVTALNLDDTAVLPVDDKNGNTRKATMAQVRTQIAAAAIAFLSTVSVAGLLTAPVGVAAGAGTVATTGSLRVANNQGMTSRNQANNADVDVIYLDTSDRSHVGALAVGTTISVGGAAVLQSTVSVTGLLTVAPAASTTGLTITPVTGTNAAIYGMSSTGGVCSIGMDNSVAGHFGQGAYNLAIYAPASRAVNIFSGNILSIQCGSDGVPVFTPTVATPAGGSVTARHLLGSTAGFGIYYGSGAPTVSAAQGSLYLRSDAASNVTRAYINTNGATTWTAINTVA